MARGIKDKVAILGMGCSKFGERWDSGAEELMVEAYKECLADAGIDQKQLEAAWFSTAIDEVACRQVGHPAVDHAAPAQHPGDACREHVRLGHRGLPRRRATPSPRARPTFALALGVEKLKDTGYGGLPGGRGGPLQATVERRTARRRATSPSSPPPT